MATKRQQETQNAINAIEAAITTNFGGKTAVDFTKESLKTALGAVNKPLVALLFGIAPNRKGVEKPDARNPRANGAQALELAAAYSEANIMEISKEVGERATQQAAQAAQAAQGSKIPVSPNMPQMGITTGSNGQIQMIPPTDKASMEQMYATQSFDNFAFSPEVIYQMYTWGETILVKNPTAKRNKILKWGGIIAGIAIGGFFIWKWIDSNKSKADISVDGVDVDLDADDPYVQVDVVDIGGLSHDDVVNTSTFAHFM